MQLAFTYVQRLSRLIPHIRESSGHIAMGPTLSRITAWSDDHELKLLWPLAAVCLCPDIVALVELAPDPLTSPGRCLHDGGLVRWVIGAEQLVSFEVCAAAQCLPAVYASSPMNAVLSTRPSLLLAVEVILAQAAHHHEVVDDLLGDLNRQPCGSINAGHALGHNSGCAADCRKESQHRRRVRVCRALSSASTWLAAPSAQQPWYRTENRPHRHPIPKKPWYRLASAFRESALGHVRSSRSEI